MPDVKWMTVAELPWLRQSAPAAALLKTGDRLLKANNSQELVSELAAGIGAATCVLVARDRDWRIVVERGDWEGKLPTQLLNSLFERDGAAWVHDPLNGPTVLAPLPLEPQQALLVSGPRIVADQLDEVLTLSRVVARRLEHLRVLDQSQMTADRLRKVLEFARSFAGEKDTESLLKKIAEEAARLMGCDRASIFLWDRDQHQLVACPALGVSGGRIFLPDNKGIVGEVIHTRQPVIVDDAYADARFEQSVDKASGYRTRNLLCVPMFDARQNCIGAFELINKLQGDFTREDQAALQDLAIPVATAVTTTRELENLTRSNEQLFQRTGQGGRIVGDSPAIVAQRSTIERLAATELPVLILGESGTGKEVAAQALHYQGPRAKRPFVAVNCAALTETLLESELFGHEKGAFTDAHVAHTGKFELAEGGTLFLDEIGDMSLGGQAKLLRVLEQKVITRVGGTVTIPVNVRVLAATNANLAELVREKKFRQDLYYRLSVVTLEIPPLRDRPEDILPLAKFFLARFCRDANRRELGFSSEAEKRMQMHHWPGNVRELRNLMERVAFLAGGDKVEVDDLAFILSPRRDADEDLSEGLGLMDATERFQADYIKRAVKRMQGNMSDAAEMLGLHRSNLYRKMRQLGMEVEDVKP